MRGIVAPVKPCCCLQNARSAPYGEAEPLTRHVQEDAMTRAARLCVLAGLTAIAAMTTANASAQECPEWLRWVCPEAPAPDAAARKGNRREKPLSRTKATSGAVAGRAAKQAKDGADAPANPKPQRTQAPAPAARHAQDGDPSADQRLARRGERQRTSLEPAMNDREKEVLFQQFLEWQRERNPNAESNR
jgi:hypothetical protein